MLIRRLLVGCCLLASVLSGAEVNAGILAATFGSLGVSEGNNNSRALGWGFRPEVDIEVTRLGVFDAGDPGLLQAHNVGLFTNSGDTLATVEVPAGESAALVDGSRLVDLASPVSLTAGTAYLLLADNWSQDEFVFSLSNGLDFVSFDSNINWLAQLIGATNSIFSSVSIVQSDDRGLLGPNLVFELSDPVQGDYDGDGLVGPGDYDEWLNSFGQQGSGLAADGNGDQVVNAADYAIWRTALGVSASVAAVPEPSAVVLWGVAGAGLLVRANRR